MKNNKLLAGALGIMVTLCIVGLVTAIMGSSIGPWPVAGPLPVQQQGYTISSGTAGPNSGHFAFSSTAAGQTFCLSTGTNTTTSVPANWLLLQLAGTGVLTTGGSTGYAFTTTQISAGTLNTGGSPATSVFNLQLTPGNLNSLYVTGTGQVGYIYGN